MSKNIEILQPDTQSETSEPVLPVEINPERERLDVARDILGEFRTREDRLIHPRLSDKPFTTFRRNRSGAHLTQRP